jgi:hypothetical protein
MSFAQSHLRSGRKFAALVDTEGLSVPGRLTVGSDAGALPHLAGASESDMGTIVRSAAGSAFADGASTGQLALSQASATTGSTLKSRAEEYPLENWQAVRLSQPGVFRSAMYIPELGRYVLLGEDVIQTSEDGTTWVTRASPANRWWVKMAWSKELGLLVAGSLYEDAAPVLMSSPDGITWTTRTSPTNRGVTGLAYGNGRFVAVSSTGAPISSTNGITWTSTAQPSTQIWCDLVWAPEVARFVALSSSGPSHVMTSEDGLIWTLRTTPAQTNGELVTWRSLAWSPAVGRFVAVASAGTDRVMTSEDGAVWTLRTVPLAEWRSVTWADEVGLFVAVASKAGTAGGSLMMTSPDGVTWTTRTSSQVDAYNSVVSGFSGGVLASTEITRGRYLDEGERTWHASTMTGTNFSMAWSPELNTIVTTDRKYSIDGGITWTAGAGTTGTGNGLVWAAELGMFVLPSSSTTSVLFSHDGRSWSQLSTTPIAVGGNDVAWSPQRSTFVIAGAGYLGYSTNAGLSWVTQVTPFGGNTVTGVIWVAELGRFFIASSSDSNNGFAYSTDGISWQSQPAPGTNRIYNKFAWSPELNTLICAGNSDRVAYSTTGGDSWATVPLTGSWRAAAWSPELRFFVMVGQNTAPIAYSTDGINWFTETAPGLGNQYIVLWIPELLRFVRSTSTGTTTRLEYTRRMRDLYLRNTPALKPQWVSRPAANPIGLAWSSSDDVLVASHYSLQYVSRSTTGGSSWQTIALPTINAWWGAAWAPEISTFVIGSGGSTEPVARSTDLGLNWSTHSKTMGFTRVRWIPTTPSGGKFIGWDSGTVTTESSDGGITWNSIASLTIQDFAHSSAYSRTVAVTSNTILRTTNAFTTWETQSLSGSWTAIVWIPALNRFVTTATTSLAYSDDGGLTWTTRAMTATSQPYRHLVWAPEISTVFGGSGSAVNDPGRSPRIGYSSSDGLTWVTDARFPSAGSLEAIYGAEWLGAPYYRFVAAVYGAGGIFYQTYPTAAQTYPPYALAARGKGTALRNFAFDPAAPPQWTDETVSGGNAWYGAVYARELQRFVIVANNVIRFGTTGGNSWTTATNATGSWRDVVWAPEINTFVAVADESTSDDRTGYSTTGGASWATLTTGTGRRWWSVAWAPEISTFVAVAYNGFYGRSTTGGTSWVVTDRANGWRNVAWAPEIRTFVKVAESGTNRISYSTTGGETWLDATGQTSRAWYGVAYSGELNRFVAVGSNAVSISTTGGVSWESKTIPSGTWYGVTWAPELRAFVAVGTSGIAAFSTTGGDSWVSYNRPGGTAWTLAWAPDLSTLLVPSTAGTQYRAFVRSSPAPTSLALTAGTRDVLKVNSGGIVSQTSSPFTGSHEVLVGGAGQSAALDGRIAITTGRMGTITLCDSLPEVTLATLPCDRRVYGVFRSSSRGPMVHGVGEGGIWVCDAGGAAIATGDYVCSSAVAGYSMRQPEPGLRSYTVAKLLSGCDFEAAEGVRYLAWAEKYPHVEVLAEGEANAEPGTEVTMEAAAEPPEGETAPEAAIEPPEGESAPEAATEPPEGETAPEAATEPPEGETAPEAAAEQVEGETAPEAAAEQVEGETAPEAAAEPPAPEPEGPIVLARPAHPEDNVVQISRAEYMRRVAEGKESFRAVFVGCTYHCG